MKQLELFGKCEGEIKCVVYKPSAAQFDVDIEADTFPLTDNNIIRCVFDDIFKSVINCKVGDFMSVFGKLEVVRERKNMKEDKEEGILKCYVKELRRWMV